MEFVKPEMERILFDSEDVIVTSGCNPVCSDCKLHMCTDDSVKNEPTAENILG